MTKPAVSIILPTFNEKDNIAPLIIAINKCINGPREIIVVDDDSPDGTAKEVKNLIRRRKIQNLKILIRKKNHGLTASIWEGILRSRGKKIVWMDCDFSHPPKLIPKLLHKIDGGHDIAVASRFVKGGGFKKNLRDSNDSAIAVLLSRAMNYLIQITLRGGFKDYTSGFIAIKRNVFKDIKLSGDYGEYFIDLMTRAILLGYTFVEVPFINLPRKQGKSKTGSNIYTLVARGIKYLKVAVYLFRLKAYCRLGIKKTNDIKSQKARFI